MSIQNRFIIGLIKRALEKKAREINFPGAGEKLDLSGALITANKIKGVVEVKAINFDSKRFEVENEISKSEYGNLILSRIKNAEKLVVFIDFDEKVLLATATIDGKEEPCEIL